MERNSTWNSSCRTTSSISDTTWTRFCKLPAPPGIHGSKNGSLLLEFRKEAIRQDFQTLPRFSSSVTPTMKTFETKNTGAPLVLRLGLDGFEYGDLYKPERL